MIYRKKTDLVPTQIENCEQWVFYSRGEEHPLARFTFNFTAFRSLTWLFRGNDVRDEADGISNCVEYLYVKNPRIMADLVNTKEFIAARDVIVKEIGEGLKSLDLRTNVQIETDEAAAVRNLAYLYVESKEYAPHDRVLAMLQTIQQFHLNLGHYGKKDLENFETYARTFGDFVHCFMTTLIPVLKAEKRSASKKVA